MSINESEIPCTEYANVFYKMFINSPNIVILADDEGRIILANKVFYRMFNGEIRGKDIFDIFKLNKRNVLMHLKNKEELFIEKFVFKTDEKKLWLKIHFYLVKHNEKYFLTAILNDITDIVEMAQKISDEEMMLSNILNGVEDIIIMTDLTGRITFVNSSLEKVLGFSSKDALGKKLKEFCHEEELDEAKREFKNLIEGKNIKEKRKFRFANSNGEYIWFEFLHSSLIEEKSEKVGTIIICREITEKVRMEDEKRKIKQELEYEKLKSEFLANVSHELKTPLNVVYGIVQLLEMFRNKRDSGNFVDSFDKFFPILKQNTYRLLRITNNIIDLTKADAGYLKLDLENINIVNLVEEVCTSTKAYLSAKNIELIFNTEVEEKIIACDVNKIERVLLNLLSNAVKFSNYNGKVYISIKDNGIGIPYNMQEEIFDRFKQVDFSLTRNHEGSGIGLSLVKEFINMHNGDIKVLSEVGLGTQFIIELPDIQIGEEVAATLYSEKNYLEQVHVEFSDIQK